MILGLLVTVAIGLLAYAVLSSIEEKVGAKKRLALVIGDRATAQVNVNFRKDKLTAKAPTGEDGNGKAQKRLTLDLLVRKAGLDIQPQRLRIMIAGFAIMSGLLMMILTGTIFVAVLAAVFSFVVVPRVALAILISRREAAISEQLPDALDIISRGLRSGMTVTNCMAQVADAVPDPLRSEFVNVMDLQKIGIPIAEAVKRMPERVDLLDIRFFAIVIEIQQKTGGNLAEILDNLSSVVRARREMKAKIRALTSEAKVSAVIICAVPVLFAFLSWNSDPATFSKFWTEPSGQIASVLAVTLYLVGAGIFIKLASPKI